MERFKEPGSRTRWTAVLTAGRRPRLAGGRRPRLAAVLAGGRRPRVVAAACALVLAVPLAVVAATGARRRTGVRGRMEAAGRRPR
jgi:hypothetical protein